MLSWLNANSGAVQAIAAAIVALGTIALAIITAWYVWLTRALVNTMRAELQLMRNDRDATIRERREHLISLIEHVRARRSLLPSDSTRNEKMEAIRRIPLWPEHEPAEILRLAIAFGRDAAEQAAEAVRHLAVLTQLAQEVRSTPERDGYKWHQFPFNEWGTALQGAERCLISLRTILDRHGQAAI